MPGVQERAGRNKRIVKCSGCLGRVHDEFKVCDMATHQGRKMCSKGYIIIECALCVPPVCVVPMAPVVVAVPAEEGMRAPTEGGVGAEGDRELGGDGLGGGGGSDSSGLMDRELGNGKVLYYSGDSEVILGEGNGVEPGNTVLPDGWCNKSDNEGAPGAEELDSPEARAGGEMTHCTPKLHIVPPNIMTHCTPKLHIVPPNDTLYPLMRHCTT